MRWRTSVTLFAIVFTTVAGASSAQLGLIEGLADIADLERERLATAVGVYNFVTGMLYLPASLLARALWVYSSHLAFLCSVGLSLLAAVVFTLVRPARTGPAQ